MIDLNIIEKLNVYFTLAVLSIMFSIFALIYNVAYINYGFISFVYFYATLFVNLVFKNTLKEDKIWKLVVQYFVLSIILVSWIICLLEVQISQPTL